MKEKKKAGEGERESHNEMVFSVLAAISELKGDAQNEAVQRMTLVHDAQRELGMDPRDDSQLTYNFAIKALEEEDNPRAIANELNIVNNLYNNTRYGVILEEVLRGIAQHVKDRYRLSWKDTWEIVRFYGPTMLKMHCFKT